MLKPPRQTEYILAAAHSGNLMSLDERCCAASPYRRPQRLQIVCTVTLAAALTLYYTIRGRYVRGLRVGPDACAFTNACDHSFVHALHQTGVDAGSAIFFSCRMFRLLLPAGSALPFILTTLKRLN